MAGDMRPAFESVWRATARQGLCLQVPADELGLEVSETRSRAPRHRYRQTQAAVSHSGTMLV
jgi:hypothetical protein